MKKAIIYAICFGVIAGLINFLLKTFLNVDSTLITCLNVAIFVCLGTYLGIFKKN